MACVLPCQLGRAGSSAARVKFRRPEAGLAASGGARGSPHGLRLQDDALATDAGYGGFVRTNSEVSAARQRPPLTKRLRPRHWAALDYVLYLVAATYEHRRAAVRVLVAVFGTLLADAVLLHLTGAIAPSGALVSAALCVAVAWFTGYIVRQRRRYALGLQDEAASKAVAEERLRIARELHDVVAHSMSVIAVQAGYGQYVIDTQPADARDALGAIQATSREALDDMRRMLGALRQADETDQREVAARAARDPGADEDAGYPAGESAGGSAGDSAGGPAGGSAGDAGAAPLS